MKRNNPLMRLAQTAERCLVIGLVALLTVVGCAAVKKIVKGVNDVAQVMCSVYAQDNPDRLDGLSPDAWCGIAKHLDPFIREALASQQALQQSLAPTATTAEPNTSGGECEEVAPEDGSGTGSTEPSPPKQKSTGPAAPEGEGQDPGKPPTPGSTE